MFKCRSGRFSSSLRTPPRLMNPARSFGPCMSVMTQQGNRWLSCGKCEIRPLMRGLLLLAEIAILTTGQDTKTLRHESRIDKTRCTLSRYEFWRKMCCLRGLQKLCHSIIWLAALDLAWKRCRSRDRGRVTCSLFYICISVADEHLAQCGQELRLDRFKALPCRRLGWGRTALYLVDCEIHIIYRKESLLSCWLGSRWLLLCNPMQPISLQSLIANCQHGKD
jgi:hypothetical protein